MELNAAFGEVIQASHNAGSWESHKITSNNHLINQLIIDHLIINHLIINQLITVNKQLITGIYDH